MNLSAELKSWIRKQERNSDKTKRKRERGRMSKDKDRFPKDCWEKKCEHFRIWDMSIDDMCCFCDLLQLECDACDEDYSYVRCPKQKESEVEHDQRI